MTEKTVEIGYPTFRVDDESYDVSFEIGEEAEDRLFNGFAEAIHDDVSEGHVPGHALDLFKRLADQRRSYPPWFEADAEQRTYDLELTDGDYSLLTRIIGSQLKNVIRHEGATPYEELVDAWKHITEQMGRQDSLDDLFEDSQQTLHEYEDAPSPENGRFVCWLYGVIAVYENGEDTWYRCTECETSFTELSDEHGCLDFA